MQRTKEQLKQLSNDILKLHKPDVVSETPQENQPTRTVKREFRVDYLDSDDQTDYEEYVISSNRKMALEIAKILRQQGKTAQITEIVTTERNVSATATPINE